MDASCETNSTNQANLGAGTQAPNQASEGSQRDRSWTLGVDISETEGKITGVGRYTLELLKAWVDLNSKTKAYDGSSRSPDERRLPLVPKLVLFARNLANVPAELRESIATVVATSHQAECSLGVVRWQQTQLPRLIRKAARSSLPIDLLFCPAYAIPLFTSTPTVVALHDLSFERDPGAFARKEGLRRRTLARAAARRSAGIVTISEFSRSEIENLYGVPKSKIAMVYPGCDRSIFNTTRSLDPMTCEKTPFLLAVGTLLERRNISNLIKAFAKLGDVFAAHQLIIVGSNQTQRPTSDFAAVARDAGVVDRVQFRPHVSENELVTLYRTTDLLVSLSEYEGFGLPVLEALCCGAPTLLLNTPTYSELWSGVVPMVNSAEPTAVARAIVLAAGAKPDPDTICALVDERFDQAGGAAKILRFLSDRAKPPSP